MPTILAFRKLDQEDHEFKSSLGCGEDPVEVSGEESVCVKSFQDFVKFSKLKSAYPS